MVSCEDLYALSSRKSTNGMVQNGSIVLKYGLLFSRQGVEVRGFVQRLVDICGDPVAVKENLLFVVDSIMRHAEKEDEHVVPDGGLGTGVILS